ncbi:MAG: IS3 family transposase [Pseudomonadales bacterium]
MQQKAYPVTLLCEVMEVSRSGYYKFINTAATGVSLETVRLKADCNTLFAASRQSYGSRRMAKGMRVQGYSLGRYQARTLMKKLGLQVKIKKRFCVTTDSKHAYPVANNILARQFDVNAPNQVWGTDLTYLWTQAGWVYLAVVIDLFSRQVAGWALKPHMTTNLVLEALRKAFWARKPEKGLLHHSDRGSQYASDAYQAELKQFGMTCSMSRKANCLDNSVVERFFRSLKSECTHHYQFANAQQAEQVVRDYILMFYNSHRLHSYLGYQSPMQYEKQYFDKAA